MMRTKLISILLLLFCVGAAYSQQELKLNQVVNNQLLINPAYAGTRNAFTTNIFSKKQWLGVEGAPTIYGISVHSPVNKSMANLGLIVRNDQYGPINHYNLKAIYSYILKLNGQTFLSLGMNVGLTTFNLKTSGLRTYDEVEDPQFAYDLSNKFKPNFGIGAFLYKPWMYVGVSCPLIWENKVSSATDESDDLYVKTYRDVFVSAGVILPLNDQFKIKPNFLFTFRSDCLWYFDTNIQFIFSKFIWCSVLYRYQTRYALSCHLQITKSIGLDYSYDIPVQTVTGNPGGHEIGITIDYEGWFRKTRRRKFDRKPKKEAASHKPGMRSIRYF